MSDDFPNKYIKKAAILLLVLLILLFLLVKNPRPYINGLFFGGVIDILLFRLMFLTLKKTVEKTPVSAQRHARFNYFIRYLIKAAVLMIAALADYISFGTTVVGLFLMKFVILGNSFIEYTKEKKGGSNEKRNNL